MAKEASPHARARRVDVVHSASEPGGWGWPHEAGLAPLYERCGGRVRGGEQLITQRWYGVGRAERRACALMAELWSADAALTPGASGVRFASRPTWDTKLPWEATDGVGTDIASYLENGEATRTLYDTDYPNDVQRVIAEPARATQIHQP